MLLGFHIKWWLKILVLNFLCCIVAVLIVAGQPCEQVCWRPFQPRLAVYSRPTLHLVEPAGAVANWWTFTQWGCGVCRQPLLVTALPSLLLHCQLMDGREQALRNVNSEGNSHFKEGFLCIGTHLSPATFLSALQKHGSYRLEVNCFVKFLYFLSFLV